MHVVELDHIFLLPSLMTVAVSAPVRLQTLHTNLRGEPVDPVAGERDPIECGILALHHPPASPPAPEGLPGAVDSAAVHVLAPDLVLRGPVQVVRA